ncbi:uncharacterized protein E0L32_001434 [Thyridium curvatum]|uniref:Transcription initiation factor IIE subunit beta n=1 Tax=Thyridium curvatum TaxID=1093900 RepID=A0A507ARZ5_9PEZI|nr:uncharacterized protein E0L32_001434 [Thyridium curvatum]TPX10237.1 hypothetical protein E0L32_001434 [Thyridium curvatum]
MSSYLERQRDAFSGGLAAMAAKMPAKRAAPTAPASPSPSVASTTSVVPTAGGTPTKKVKRDAGAAIYSQPENTGVGTDISTKIVYAVEYLKNNGKPLALETVFSHLNVNREAESVQREVVSRLRNHPRITWKPDPNLSEQAWNSGTYEHKPVIPSVKDKTSLLNYLQKLTDARGVTVKDLKDGWPTCEDALTELEKEHKILVVRTKKDNHPKMVWLDDASLHHGVDDEFRALWGKVNVPSIDDIVHKLSAVGQKPTSEDPRLKVVDAPKEKKQKKRIQRRPGKTTNAHMNHLLKDFSHMKR